MITGTINILIFCLSALSMAYGQTFNFVNYDGLKGLPDLYVYHLSQAKNGFLYLTTGEGLYRYDGLNFEELSNKKGKENFITVHLLDSRGILWAGHNQKGISFLKGSTWKELSHPELIDSKITALVEGEHHSIWVATSGAGLYLVDSSFKIAKVSGLQVSNISSMIPGEGNSLVLGDENACYHVKVTSQRSVLNGSARMIGNTGGIKKLCPGNINGDFWMLTQDNVIMSWHFIKGQFEPGRKLYNELETDNELSTIYVDRYGILWVGEVGAGIMRIGFSQLPDGGKIWINHYGEKNGLNAQHVQCIFQDAEDNIWLGSFGNGLIRKTAEKFAFYSKKEGLLHNNCRKIASGGRGQLWIAGKNGVSLFEPATGLSFEYDLPGHDQDEFINAIMADSISILYIATNKNLYELDVAGSKFINLSATMGLGKVNFTCLMRNDSQIVAGSMVGIYYLNLRNREHSLVTMNEGLLHNNIINLFMDRHKRLWVCSHGTPPYYIKDDKVVAFKNLSGYNSFKVNAVTEDKEGNIWIATDGDGLFRYKNNEFVCYTSDKGLYSNFCSGLVCDFAGSVWAIHSEGLSELKRGQEQFTSFSSSSGLMVTEFNSNSICINGQDVWFGSTTGLLHYKSGENVNSRSSLPVNITGISFNSKRENIDLPVSMPFDYYLVKIDFIAVSLSRAGQLIYHYRIPEIDSNWRHTSGRFVELPHLGDGTYTFEIKAGFNNEIGNASQGVSRLTFVIEKPVWKKPWFYVLATILLISLTFVIIQLRTRQLRKMQMLLQLKVKQKTFLLQREKEAVEKIKGELEKRNKDMTDSIHYARHIQQAILPPDETMEELFGEDYFVLFKPKDIVSGDLFWAAALNVNNNNKNDLSLAAVVDCTGHGVPGAFLSIMASDVLKQSIIDRDVNNTNEILDFLNHEVTSHLNPTGHRERLKDGMDIALIGIEWNQKKLYYSGANNPVYIIREEAGKTDVIILKATKQPIGSVSEGVLKFDRQEFDLKAGDTIYLFSDGYADQFGGERNKKFTYKRFREVLCEAYHMSMPEQKDFLFKQFSLWKTNGEQTDDVCIMGIRI